MELRESGTSKRPGPEIVCEKGDRICTGKNEMRSAPRRMRSAGWMILDSANSREI